MYCSDYLLVIVHSGKYNEYLEVNGGNVGRVSCNRAETPNDVHRINKDTPLIKFISLKDATKSSWLYIVLVDVVSTV